TAATLGASSVIVLFTAPRKALSLALPSHQRTEQEQHGHNEQDPQYGALSPKYPVEKI
ncbi:hypothetical protein Pgy4_37216, partial [Pseudomonas savastanoi pv. glycinea str. race 4]